VRVRVRVLELVSAPESVQMPALRVFGRVPVRERRPEPELERGPVPEVEPVWAREYERRQEQEQALPRGDELRVVQVQVARLGRRARRSWASASAQHPELRGVQLPVRQEPQPCQAPQPPASA